MTGAAVLTLLAIFAAAVIATRLTFACGSLYADGSQRRCYRARRACTWRRRGEHHGFPEPVHLAGLTLGLVAAAAAWGWFTAHPGPALDNLTDALDYSVRWSGDFVASVLATDPKKAQR